MPLLTQGRRYRGASRTVPPGLRGLLASLAIALLASGSPGREDALKHAISAEVTPRDLGDGLTLLSVRAEGTTLFRAISSELPFEPPGDQQLRVMLRDRCGDEQLRPLLARGVVVHESRSFGPFETLVFTLTMSSTVCDQVGMERTASGL